MKALGLFKSMYLLKGVGLSAPQVGLNERLIVLNPEGGRGKGNPKHEVAMINPKVSLDNILCQSIN
jgi:peptide deformylase